jgi:hypothetical protein
MRRVCNEESWCLIILLVVVLLAEAVIAAARSFVCVNNHLCARGYVLSPDPERAA